MDLNFGVIGRIHQAMVFGRRAAALSEHLALLLPNGATVLDIGCGEGTLAASLMERRPDVKISGVDVLVRPHSRIPVRAFDGTHLPFGDKTFDVALLVDVLHHTDDPVVMLREADRVARRHVVLKDHALRGLAARPTLIAMDWVGNAHAGVRLPYNYWTPEQWTDAFDVLGLTVEQHIDRLDMYPRPARWLFDRRLHFIAVLSKRQRTERAISPAQRDP